MGHPRGAALVPGEVLWHEGETGAAMAVVVSGRLDVVIGGVPTNAAGRGELVGEIAVFTGWPRSATVRAATAARVLVLSREGYHALRHTGVVAAIERRLTQDQVARLRRCDARRAVDAPDLDDDARRALSRGARRGARPAAGIDVGEALRAHPLFTGESPD